MLLTVVLFFITLEYAFDVANSLYVFFCVPAYSFMSVFMLLYRTVHTCQVQNVILRQGMSNLITV